jgi:hypothetical protein
MGNSLTPPAPVWKVVERPIGFVHFSGFWLDYCDLATLGDQRMPGCRVSPNQNGGSSE